MFPTHGYFSTVKCPDNSEGKCYRKCCPFFHSKTLRQPVKHANASSHMIEDSNRTGACNISETSQVHNTPSNVDIHSNEGDISSISINENESTVVCNEALATSQTQGNNLVSIQDEVQEETSVMFDKLISEAVKKVLFENNELSANFSNPEEIIKKLNAQSLITKAINDLSTATKSQPTPPKFKAHKLYLPPPDAPKYKPTPLKVLEAKSCNKKSIQAKISLSADEYTPTPITNNDELTDFSSDDISENEAKLEFDMLEDVLVQRSSDPIRDKEIRKRKKALGKITPTKKSSILTSTKTSQLTRDVIKAKSNIDDADKSTIDSHNEEYNYTTSISNEDTVPSNSSSPVPNEKVQETFKCNIKKEQTEIPLLIEPEKLQATNPTIQTPVSTATHNLLPQIAQLSRPNVKSWTPMAKIDSLISVEKMLEKLDSLEPVDRHLITGDNERKEKIDSSAVSEIKVGSDKTGVTPNTQVDIFNSTTKDSQVKENKRKHEDMITDDCANEETLVSSNKRLKSRDRRKEHKKSKHRHSLEDDSDISEPGSDEDSSREQSEDDSHSRRKKRKKHKEKSDSCTSESYDSDDSYSYKRRKKHYRDKKKHKKHKERRHHKKTKHKDRKSYKKKKRSRSISHHSSYESESNEELAASNPQSADTSNITKEESDPENDVNTDFSKIVVKVERDSGYPETKSNDIKPAADVTTSFIDKLVVKKEAIKSKTSKQSDELTTSKEALIDRGSTDSTKPSNLSSISNEVANTDSCNNTSNLLITKEKPDSKINKKLTRSKVDKKRKSLTEVSIFEGLEEFTPSTKSSKISSKGGDREKRSSEKSKTRSTHESFKIHSSKSERSSKEHSHSSTSSKNSRSHHSKKDALDKGSSSSKRKEEFNNRESSSHSKRSTNHHKSGRDSKKTHRHSISSGASSVDASKIKSSSSSDIIEVIDISKRKRTMSSETQDIDDSKRKRSSSSSNKCDDANKTLSSPTKTSKEFSIAESSSSDIAIESSKSNSKISKTSPSKSHRDKDKLSKRKRSSSKDSKKREKGETQYKKSVSPNEFDDTFAGSESPLPDLSALDDLPDEDWDHLLSSANDFSRMSDDTDEGVDFDSEFVDSLEADDPKDPKVLEECMKVFSEFKSDDSAKSVMAKKETTKKRESDKTEENESASSKSRVARLGAQGNLVAKPRALVKPRRKTPAEVMLERYQKLKDEEQVLQKKLEMQQKELEKHKVLPYLAAVSPVKSSASTDSTKPSSSSIFPPEVPVPKKRVARAPSNVSALLKFKQELKNAKAATTSKSPDVTSAQTQSYTVATTAAKGSKRLAHVPNNVALERPVISVEGGSKVPQNVRQRYLNTFINETLKFCDGESQSFDVALAEESICHKRASNRMVYLNLAVNVLKKLRSGQISEAAQELLGDKPSYGNYVEKTMASTSNTKKSEHALNLNHCRVSHFTVMASGGEKGSWSIQKPKKLQDSDVKNSLSGVNFYKILKKYILSSEQLDGNGFPRPDPDVKGKAILKRLDTRKKISPNEHERYCDRCSIRYAVDEWGLPTKSSSCVYHWGRPYKRRGFTGLETRYSCCQGDNESGGCCLGTTHVSQNFNPEALTGYVRTFPKQSNAEGDEGVYALDCEMCYTTSGNELTRITIVDTSSKSVYETLVKPDNPIIDYNTRFSGITEEDMESVQVTLRDVQAALLTRFSAKTILIGHSLESDFSALKLIHDTVVDTSVVFPHKLGPPFKRALRNLASDCLVKIIQNDVSGHDSAEDAITCMQLMQWKIKEDLKSSL